MEVELFFKNLLAEVEANPSLQGYYRFLESDSRFEFRKAYFCQRLQYIKDRVQADMRIWDCGCGYGTTGLFLAMNGIKSHGTTLEFYYKEISARMEYWRQFGKADLFSASYENLFDSPPDHSSCDAIIIQDTLHHLEPLQQALQILKNAMANDGVMIAVEENGSNVIQNAKLFLRRGNKRIIEIWDEQLQKHILLGNENIKSLQEWDRQLQHAGMRIVKTETQFIRVLPPSYFNTHNVVKRIEQEQRIWKKYPLLRDHFFFGINFIAVKN